MPLPSITLTEWYAADIDLRTRDEAFRKDELAFRREQATAYQVVNASSTAAQNARAAAEHAVAAMGSKQADAQIAAAAAFSKPAPGPTDAELLLSFMQTFLSNGVASASAGPLAKAALSAYKTLTYKPPAAPL